MNEAAYIEERLDNQIQWYDLKSQSCQVYYKRLKMLEYIAAAIIPLCSTVLDTWTYFPWLVGGLGVIIAVDAAALSLYKFHENWIQYRTTSEQLKHEKYLFLTQVNPYDGEDAFQQLVARVEGMISKENSSWAQTGKQEIKKDESA